MIKKPCKIDSDFQRSITFQREVEVWIDGELDTVGKVEKFTTDSVKIDGSHFMKANCVFFMV